MITNGLTPVFGSEPLSWGTFGILFGPPGSRSVASLCPLGDALEIHAGLLQSTSREALCRPPCGGLGGILSRPAPFCLFRGHKCPTLPPSADPHQPPTPAQPWNHYLLN